MLQTTRCSDALRKALRMLERHQGLANRGQGQGTKPKHMPSYQLVHGSHGSPIGEISVSLLGYPELLVALTHT
jgi:hypothetical protein